MLTRHPAPWTITLVETSAGSSYCVRDARGLTMALIRPGGALSHVDALLSACRMVGLGTDAGRRKLSGRTGPIA